jgi:hypothetical protein
MNPAGYLLPNASSLAGQPLWGAPARKQPVLPMIVLAFVLLLVAAPAAMSGGGQSSNPIALMHDIADSTYTITGLMTDSNKLLNDIDQNARPLAELQVNMGAIAAGAAGMNDKTTQLNESLGSVGTSVKQSRAALEQVDGKLSKTASTMGQLNASVNGSLGSTKAVVGEFKTIDGSIHAMDGNLKQVIVLMSVSTPQTEAFANNKTRLAIAGGDSQKFGVPNIAPGSRVMSVVLPMIYIMQHGGPMPARKDSAEASNPLVGFILKTQVPDGTNVAAMVQPYDGYYGMPGSAYFVSTPVAGF